MRKGVLFLLFSVYCGLFFAQNRHSSDTLFFISDCQEPMKAERLILNAYRNTEARDSLFADITRHRPGNLFLLGDLVSQGSIKSKWLPVMSYIETLRNNRTSIYAIPGNHEYYASKKRGIRNFLKYFPDSKLSGWCIKIDSTAIIMLNSNITKMREDDLFQQGRWYRSIMDSLDSEVDINAIIVCTHHSPFTNSKIVEPSGYVADSIVPRYIRSPKTKLLISGHSHNLELFSKGEKYFLVAGGGGGLIQPLLQNDKRLFDDILIQNQKPLYFYILLVKSPNGFIVKARGLDKEFLKVKDFEVVNMN